jgi:uncharacterized protein (UPF0210 family)
MPIARIALPAWLLASFCLAQAAAAQTAAPANGPQTPPAAAALRPKVRAITGFVRLDPVHYVEQVDAALAVLHDAQREFQSRGYEVETIRIVTQPLAELVQGQSESQALAFLGKLDALSAQAGFMPDIGPAMLRDSDDPRTMHLLERALATLTHVNGNAILADEEGIHWRVVHASAALIHYLSEHSPHSQGNFNFAATAMLKPYGPFFPGTYYTGAADALSIGYESANIVQAVFSRTQGDFAASVTALTEALSVPAKVAEEVGMRVAAAHGWTYKGMDPTPAPLGDTSIGAAMETYTGARFGSSGTMTAALVITTAVKAVPVKQIGYAGLMVPVMEDKLLAERWAQDAYGVDALLAYSAVCGTGLDTVPFPGEITEQQLARILGDVAALAWKWHKPLSARLLPVKDKKAGDETEFQSQYLFNTRIHPLP